MATFADLTIPAKVLTMDYDFETREYEYPEVTLNIRDYCLSTRGNTLTHLSKFIDALKNIPFESLRPDQQLTDNKPPSSGKTKANCSGLNADIAAHQETIDAQNLINVTRAMKIMLIADITGEAPTEATEITDKESIDLFLKAMVYFTNNASQDAQLYKLISKPTITFPDDYLAEKTANGEMDYITQAICLTNKSTAEQLIPHLSSQKLGQLNSKITEQQNNITSSHIESSEQLDNLQTISEMLSTAQASRHSNTSSLTQAATIFANSASNEAAAVSSQSTTTATTNIRPPQ